MKTTTAGRTRTGIKWGNLAKFTDCGNKKICIKSFSWDGTQWLDLRVGAHIGEYRIQQLWQLSRDGRIAARVWSRGVSCETDHVHHPYWRLDFDVDGENNNEVLVKDEDNWGVYTTETAVKKKHGRRWLVRNSASGHAVWIVPGPNDGTADSFSKADLAIRRYHHSEDEPWPFGAKGGLGYDNDEEVRGKDIVVWYIPHLSHSAHDEEKGSLSEWIKGGPTLEILPSQILFAGLFGPGEGGQSFVAGLSFDELVQLWTDLGKASPPGDMIQMGLFHNFFTQDD